MGEPRKTSAAGTIAAGGGPRGAAELPGACVDPDAQLLWRGGIEIPLRPRTWAVLRHLMERPGILVTKEELLDAVWSGVTVTEATLSQSISELREALGDDARQPRFIATVYRRGFRFVGDLPVSGRPKPSHAAPAAAAAERGPGALVGRDDVLHRLGVACAQAGDGARRLVLVSGEPGIGKTTVATAFLGSLGRDVAVGLGTGMSELAEVEPFYPFLEALRMVMRGPHRVVASEVLRAHAPSWLHERVGLVASRAAPDPGDAQGAPTRMLLTLARAIEALARATPLVLVLEDLHWADQATCDLLALLARRTEPARLLLVATYRPSEAVLRGDRLDRLRRESTGDARFLHLPLERLSADACDALLRARFGGCAPPAGVTGVLHAHTDGVPLFLVAAVDHLVERGWLHHADDRLSLRCSLATIDATLPADLVTLVEHETRRLAPDEARVLEAGSVAGAEFSVQEVAAALEIDVEQVERCLEGLASASRFVRCVGTDPWPDDSVGSRWQFVHALHRRALRDRIAAGRLQRWHQRIGERIEAGWATRREQVVSTLATHFEASRDRARALEYLDEAARVAERRCAPADAKQFLSRALQRLIESRGIGGDRARELQLRVRLVTAINAMEGYASAELREQLRQAIALCRDPGYERFRFRLSFALVASCVSGNDPRVKEHLQDLRGQAEALGVPGAGLLCEALSGVVALFEGRLGDAAQLDRLVDAGDRVDDDLYVGSHFRVLVPVWSALRRCAIGDTEEARRRSEEALARARRLPDRINEAFALYGAAQIAVFEGDRDRLEAIALRSEVLTHEYGYRNWGGLVAFFQRRLQVLEDRRPGGFDALRELAHELGIDASPQRAAVCCGLAEVALRERRFDEGFAAIESGLAAIASGFARAGHSELLRIRAALRRASGQAPDRVREDLEAALAIATEQGAGAYAARVAADLAVLAAPGTRSRDRRSPRLRIARGRRSD